MTTSSPFSVSWFPWGSQNLDGNTWWAFLKASSALKIKDVSKLNQEVTIKKVNNYQKFVLQKIVVEKLDILVNLPTGPGKSLIRQALPMVFDGQLSLWMSLAWKTMSFLLRSDKLLAFINGPVKTMGKECGSNLSSCFFGGRFDWHPQKRLRRREVLPRTMQTIRPDSSKIACLHGICHN